MHLDESVMEIMLSMNDRHPFKTVEVAQAALQGCHSGSTSSTCLAIPEAPLDVAKERRSTAYSEYCHFSPCSLAIPHIGEWRDDIRLRQRITMYLYKALNVICCNNQMRVIVGPGTNTSNLPASALLMIVSVDVSSYRLVRECLVRVQVCLSIVAL